MRHLLLSIVLASFSLIGLSQNPSESTTKALDSLVYWVSQNIQTPLIDSTLVYRNAHKALKLSEGKNNKIQLATSYRNLATWHLKAKTIDSTAFYLFLAESIYKELNLQKSLSETYVELENAFNQRADYSEAMIYSFKSLEINEKLGDQRGIANSYTRLCDLLYYQDKNEEGAKYCQKAIAIHKKLDHPEDLARSYQFLGNNQLFQNKLDSAYLNVNKSIAILEKENITGLPLMGSRNSRGNILKYMDRLEEALLDYKKNLEEAKRLGNVRYTIVSGGNIGHVYSMQKKYDEALPYFLNTIDVIKESGNTKNLWENYMHASIVYEEMGDYEKSLEYNILYNSEYKKYLGSIIERLESELQIKYETAKKDETIEVQEAKITQQRRNQLLYISIAGLLSIILLGMYFALKNIRKKRKKLAELNNELEVKRKAVEVSNEALKNSLEELKLTQAQLIQSEKMASLGELTAGIAHEIQNPLNFVNNFSDVSSELIDEMNEEITKGDIEEAKIIALDIKRNLEKISHHGKRADGIVKGMLQHSRKSNGEKEPTDINVLADEYLRLAYHGLRAKNKSFSASLNTNYDEKIDKINIIPGDVGRVILNLITNAFYAIEEKKKQQSEGYEPAVSVSTEKKENLVFISVKDNGNGIPKKVMDKIFQPFFTTKPTGEGTGLGLSLSYDIIKAQGGEIKVTTIEGEGSEFIIELPIT